jgi:signal transduction histidine kinase
MKDSAVRRPARLRVLSGPSQKLIGVFVLFILLPGAFLGGFAFRVLRQEGQLARQRTRESLERTADEIGRYLDSEFRRWSDAVRSAAGEGMLNADSFPEIIRQAFAEPGGGMFLSVSKGDLETFPSGALLYRPSSLPGPQTPASRPSAGLAEAESLEISRKDYERATRAYRSLLDSAGAGLRPLVLQRLARTLRKAGRLDESAAAYRDLQHLDTIWIGDLPSDLIAQSELCTFVAERGDWAGLAAQALAFYSELTGGKWLLDKPRYLYYSDRCQTWCRESRVAGDEFDRLRTLEEQKLALSRAVEELLNAPKRVISSESKAHLAFWNTGPYTALVLSADFLKSHWWPQALSARGEDLKAALISSGGYAVFGSPPAETPPFAVTQDLRIDETSWLLQVWPGRPEAIYADIRQRQTLSMAILAFVAVLLAFGSYITVRIVRRELEIARLRADFVSTVSHEFRSPLTGIRQLGEMLLDGRVTDPEKQRGYFRMIVQESDRLARLVENILDFSRMEEGRREYQFEPLNPSPWLRTLVADFVTEIAANGAAVEPDVPDGLPPISADKEALGSAVRNLLDNAVKYSPGTKTVRIGAAASGGEVRIFVQDRGVGISEQDRRRIFDRFYRADGEISKRVKGAGLGLSLVKHIVTAHGGTVECESRLGEGSTFTIRLPAAPVTGG